MNNLSIRRLHPTSRLGLKMNILFFLLFFGYSTNLVIGQEFCYSATTPSGSSGFQPSNNINHPTYYLRVFVHVIRKTDGTGGQTFADIQAALSILNGDFNGHNIYFVWDECIKYIDSDTYFYTDSWGVLDQLFGIERHSYGIDIYALPDEHLVKGGSATIGTTLTGLWLGGVDDRDGGSVFKSHTISHEMGHVLNLWHTFHGCETGNWENTDGSNCETAGDFVCDTPADPGMAFGVNSYSCIWNGFNSSACFPPPEDLSLYSPDTENFMAYTKIPCMNHFSEGQAERMQNSIASLSFLNSCLIDGPEAPLPCSCAEIIDINENTTYDTDQLIKRNIYVHSGNQLTITANIQFGNRVGIIVERGAKLHIDGGTLTRCPSTHDWRGINVEGYVDRAQPDAFAAPDPTKAGIVLMTNGAKIEWARNAISTSKLDQIWNRDYWGGLVVATSNSRFRNNKRAVEFMKYPENSNSSLTNTSYFEDCIFEEYILNAFVGTFGVTIWSTDGIYFEGCTFQNLDRQGLTIYDASADVTIKNTFQNLERGIETYATHPYTTHTNIGLEGTPIQDVNEFKNNDEFDIIGCAMDEKDGIKVVNNKFEAGLNSFKSVFFIGPTFHEVKENSFVGYPWGFIGRKTGPYVNRVQCNYFWNVSTGVSYWGNNKFSQFLKNDFNCDKDVSLRHWGGVKGEVNFLQGEGLGADNCFTLGTDDITAHPTLVEEFNYYTTDFTGDPNTSCLVPSDNLSDGGSQGNNYYLRDADEPVECLPGVPGGGSGNCTFTNQDWIDVLALVDQLTGDLLNDPNNEAIRISLSEAENLKEQIFRCQLNDGVYNNDLNAVYLLLDQEGSNNAQRLKFGIMLNYEDFVGAQSLLLQLPGTTTDDIYFKQVQGINLLRMTSSGEFILSQTQEDLLTDIALSHATSSAYARSLLALLLDIRLPYDDVEIPINGQQPSSTATFNVSETVFSIRNNPVLDLLSVHTTEPQEQELYLEVIDINGHAVTSAVIAPLSQQFEIDLSLLASGMYFVVITNQTNDELFTAKIIKQ